MTQCCSCSPTPRATIVHGPDPGRGGLPSQDTLPEKGSNGNATVTDPSSDARGHLLKKYDGGATTFTLRGLDGALLREVELKAGAYEWVKDYIYRDGLLLASQHRTEGHQHYHLDHLGTTRMLTNRCGERVKRYELFPYGDTISAPANDTETRRFTGHQRDLGSPTNTTDDLEYMHARYYGVKMGRLLSVDPIEGLSRFPQSWNKYTYTRGNPQKYTDPTGLYTLRCVTDDEQCAADAEAFEKARQQLLKSKDAEIATAAAAWGDPGQENGVTLAFGSPGDAASGVVSIQGPYLQPNGTMQMVASATILQGLRGTELLNAVAHEGSHIRDAQTFVATFTITPTFWDVTKNLTLFQTEMNAFRITHKVYSSANQSFSAGCRGCRLGAGVRTRADVDLAITKILADPDGQYKLSPANQGKHQFELWVRPPEQP